MDDPFVSCPYDPKHRVPRSRIQRHIVKCQEKYPKLAICPYNATHRLPEKEMKLHMPSCPSKQLVFSEKMYQEASAGALVVPRPINQSDYLSETDPAYESWDN
jgi:hypothetical protein